MSSEINWEELTRRFCTKTETGFIYSSEDARQAINELLGRRTIESAVNEYIFKNSGIGSELARHFLNVLKSDYAVDYVYSIYKTEPSLDLRISAIELFRYVVTPKSLKYYPELINDPNTEIRRWATYTIDQLIFQGFFSTEDLAEEIQALEMLNPDLFHELTNGDI